MASTMREALASASVSLTLEEERKEQEQRNAKHRSKTVLDRPKQEFELRSLTEEPFERKKYQADPTADLLELPPSMTYQSFAGWHNGLFADEKCTGYMVWCKDTLQLWYAPTKLCLDQNFIYRSDLEILKVSNDKDAWDFYTDRAGMVNPGIITKKTCYILDNPAGETYEVYYDSAYPSMKYGKATPNGMFVHKYGNRFHRDMAVMELDNLYAEESSKKAGEFVSEPLKANEAIVISDGCFMRNVCTCAHYYLDNITLIKMTQGLLPSDIDQAVLIAEVSGATNALAMCRAKGKKKITYYYDNTSIINVFRNRKTEYLEEIVAYKKLLEEMDAEGYDVKFVELHPKTGDDRVDANKALMFFHNYCDKECQEMVNVFTKDYKKIAESDNPEGKTFKQVKQEFKPKGKPGQGSNNPNGRPKNNQRNGNNRYGKSF